MSTMVGIVLLMTLMAINKITMAMARMTMAKIKITLTLTKMTKTMTKMTQTFTKMTQTLIKYSQTQQTAAAPTPHRPHLQLPRSSEILGKSCRFVATLSYSFCKSLFS